MTIISLFLLDYDCKACGRHMHRTFLSEEERDQSLEALNRLCYGCLMEAGPDLIRPPKSPRRGRPPKAKA